MKSDFQKGILGVVTQATGIGVSLSDVESWLRITSLVVGISVGLATIYSILKKK